MGNGKPIFVTGPDRSGTSLMFALFHRPNAERVGKPRWGDKSLHSGQHADQIFEEFPGAKIIHMMRDPRDRYASVLKRYDDKLRGMTLPEHHHVKHVKPEQPRVVS